MRLALEGAFETAVAQRDRHVIDAARTTGVDDRTRRRRSARGHRACHSRVAALARDAATRAVRNARRHRHARHRRSHIACGFQQSFALSPDGRQIVFVASGDGASRLWLRSLATTTAQPLAGTEGATSPFWAPDSRSVGFFAAGALKRLDLGGGAPQTLAPAENGNGGTWNTDGVIVFAPSANSALMRVSATGGAATAVTTLGPQQLATCIRTFCPMATDSCSTWSARRTRPGSTWARSTGALRPG